MAPARPDGAHRKELEECRSKIPLGWNPRKASGSAGRYKLMQRIDWRPDAT